jgi:hypothetical protein
MSGGGGGKPGLFSQREFWDPNTNLPVYADVDTSAVMRVKFDNSPGSMPVRVVEIDSDTLLVDSKGNEIKIFDLIKRLESLEAAYMEEKLLGKTE